MARKSMYKEESLLLELSKGFIKEENVSTSSRRLIAMLAGDTAIIKGTKKEAGKLGESLIGHELLFQNKAKRLAKVYATEDEDEYGVEKSKRPISVDIDKIPTVQAQKEKDRYTKRARPIKYNKGDKIVILENPHMIFKDYAGKMGIVDEDFDSGTTTDWMVQVDMSGGQRTQIIGIDPDYLDIKDLSSKNAKRYNREQLIEAFTRNRAEIGDRAGSLTVDKKDSWTILYSYDTPIAAIKVRGELIMNNTKYSVTTSNAQGLIRKYSDESWRKDVDEKEFLNLIGIESSGRMEGNDEGL